MMQTTRVGRSLLILVAGSLFAGANAAAQEEDFPKMRWEVWLAATYWSGLNDLLPSAGGTFDEVGFGLGGGAHWPVASGARGDLLVGVEGGLMSHGSDIQGDFEDLISRDGYVAFSAKWMPGAPRGLSLDAGYAYHLIDMSQVEDDYFSYSYEEFESWEDSAGGPFVGISWDSWASRPGKSSGLSLGFEVHFVDFETVRDEDIYITPVLGPNAGTLDGPMYLFQLGYSSR